MIPPTSQFPYQHPYSTKSKLRKFVGILWYMAPQIHKKTWILYFVYHPESLTAKAPEKIPKKNNRKVQGRLPTIHFFRVMLNFGGVSYLSSHAQSRIQISQSEDQHLKFFRGKPVVKLQGGWACWHQHVEGKRKLPRPGSEPGPFRSSAWRPPNWAIAALPKLAAKHIS